MAELRISGTFFVFVILSNADYTFSFYNNDKLIHSRYTFQLLKVQNNHPLDILPPIDLCNNVTILELLCKDKAEIILSMGIICLVYWTQ